MSKAILIGSACLLAALLSLLAFNPGLTYDPAAWAVWAAELPHRTMGLGSGPSWKPLPVLLTAPFALVSWEFGGESWLVIARTGSIATSVLLWRTASRAVTPDNAPWKTTPSALIAGGTAALLPWLIPSWVQFASGGASEPVMMALLLAAVEAHLAGRAKIALALVVGAGLVRPEVWALLAIYGIYMMRRGGIRALPTLLLAALVEFIGWFGVPWMAGGDPLQATHRARVFVDREVPVDEFLRRVSTELPWEAWLLITLGVVATVVLKRRVLTAITVTGLGWLLVVTAMTEGGYSGISRYAVPALVILCATAGAGAGWAVGLVSSKAAQTAIAAAAVVFLLGTTVGRAPELSAQVNRVDRIGEIGRDSVVALQRAGGARELIRQCGALGTNWVYTPVVSWRAGVSLGNIGFRRTAPAIVLIHPRSVISGAPTHANNFQPLPPRGATSRTTITSTRDWKVVRFGSRSSRASACR
ncbi:MAG: hypothetical protein NTX07_04230 [Solirubrobacterales bacterium]|nr:hypothetical protein [Solirubrobacterales bacterium]